MKTAPVLFFAILASTSAVGQWTQTAGPVGANSNEIIYLENYLFVNGYDGGVYRSADKALTWVPVNNGLPTDFRCFAMAEENNKLYITTEHGIYFSDNLGEMWNPLTGPEISGFSIEVSGDTMFVGSSDNVSMLYSADGGATWQKKNSPVTQQSVRHLMKSGSTLWVGTDSKLYSSSDDGTTWSLPILDVQASSLDSADGDLFVSGNRFGSFGVYRSSDNGASWAQILTTQETNVPGSGFLKLGNTLYVSGLRSLYYSNDDGLTWTSQLLPQSFNLYSRTCMTHVADELFVSYGDGILFTSDQGATWERRNINYRNHSVIQLCQTNQSIVCYSEINGIYVSKDDGDSWKAIPDHDQYRPRQVYAHDNTIIASYLLGIYKSEDEGDTWQKIFTLIDDIPGPHFIPDVHLTGWKDSLVFCTYKGIYLSTDRGASWDLRPVSTFDTDAKIVKSFIQGDTIILVTQKEFFFKREFWKELGKEANT